MCAFFVQNFWRQKFKPKSQLPSFGTNILYEKHVQKELMKLTTDGQTICAMASKRFNVVILICRKTER